MLEILQHFSIAEGRPEAALKCWSLQQNAGDLATMILSTKMWPPPPEDQNYGTRRAKYGPTFIARYEYKTI